MPDYISATGSGTTVIYTKQNGDQDIYSGGSKAWRNNNPGNLRAGEFSNTHGAIGAANGMAIFPDRETGENALRSLLSGPTYSNLSVGAAIARYAPPSENSTAQYQNFIAQQVDAPAGTLVGNLTSEQMNAMIQTIERQEGWASGTITQMPAQQKHSSIDNNDLEKSASDFFSTRESRAQKNTIQSEFSTGDPDLDRLAAGLFSNDEAAISRASAQIAQSPQVQAMVQQGRDILAAQQMEEQQTIQQRGSSLSR
jgi:hypothetical protein